MRFRFPPWSTMAARWVVYGGPVILIALVCAPMIYVRTPYFQEREDPVNQPVQFDHRHHVQDDRIDCRFCHQTVETSPMAGYPSTAVCMACHTQVWNQSPLLDTIRKSYFTNTPVPWNRVHRLPQFVYFNHSAHVNKGVGCVSCHGRVDRMPMVEQVAPLTMGWCLDCHRNPTPNLRPKEFITSMTWTPAGSAERLGSELAHAYGVKARVSCTTCHR